MDKLKPKDHAEAVALFRSEIIGQLTRRELDHGELRHELRQLSKKRFRPPGSTRTRRYAVSTLERWYYSYKRGGLAALEVGCFFLQVGQFLGVGYLAPVEPVVGLL